MYAYMYIFLALSLLKVTVSYSVSSSSSFTARYDSPPKAIHLYYAQVVCGLAVSGGHK